MAGSSCLRDGPISAEPSSPATDDLRSMGVKDPIVQCLAQMSQVKETLLTTSYGLEMRQRERRD